MPLGGRIASVLGSDIMFFPLSNSTKHTCDFYLPQSCWFPTAHIRCWGWFQQWCKSYDCSTLERKKRRNVRETERKRESKYGLVCQKLGFWGVASVFLTMKTEHILLYGKWRSLEFKSLGLYWLKLVTSILNSVAVTFLIPCACLQTMMSCCWGIILSTNLFCVIWKTTLSATLNFPSEKFSSSPLIMFKAWFCLIAIDFLCNGWLNSMNKKIKKQTFYISWLWQSM